MIDPGQDAAAPRRRARAAARGVDVEQLGGAPRLDAGAGAAAVPTDPDAPQDGPEEEGSQEAAAGWTADQVEGFLRAATAPVALYYGAAHLASKGEFPNASETIAALLDALHIPPPPPGAGEGAALLPGVLLSVGDIVGYASEPARVAERQHPHGPIARLVAARRPTSPGHGVASAGGRPPAVTPESVRRGAEARSAREAAAPAAAEAESPDTFRWSAEELATIEAAGARRIELESLGLEV